MKMMKISKRFYENQNDKKCQNPSIKIKMIKISKRFSENQNDKKHQHSLRLYCRTSPPLIYDTYNFYPHLNIFILAMRYV